MPFVALAIVAIVAITAITEKGGELRLAANGLTLDVDGPEQSPEIK